MSLLTVENVTHGFGARQILENASFRLLKGEHIGLDQAPTGRENPPFSTSLQENSCLMKEI